MSNNLMACQSCQEVLPYKDCDYQGERCDCPKCGNSMDPADKWAEMGAWNYFKRANDNTTQRSTKKDTPTEKELPQQPKQLI